MLLEVKGLTAGYGPAVIVHDVDLCVSSREIVCIVGPNGAGKSTVLRAIAGQIFPIRGSVFFEGVNVTQMDPGAKGKKGIIFIPQGENIFPNLSVRENLELGAMLTRHGRDLQETIDLVFDRFPVLGKKLARPARELSGGERQLLALSRIIIVDPKLVLLDEPSLGLAPSMVDLIFKEIVSMNKDGVSFLVVEQNARKGLSVSHRAYVLELGRNRLSGQGQELLNDPEIVRLYLGG